MKPHTPTEFRKWLLNAPADAEFHYTTEALRDEQMMDMARVASEEGRVALFRLRLHGELVMVAKRLSGKSKRFLQLAPTIHKRERVTYKDPHTYVPFVQPSGRGLRQPTIPDGFDGPASRRFR